MAATDDDHHDDHAEPADQRRCGPWARLLSNRYLTRWRNGALGAAAAAFRVGSRRHGASPPLGVRAHAWVDGSQGGPRA